MPLSLTSNDLLAVNQSIQRLKGSLSAIVNTVTDNKDVVGNKWKVNTVTDKKKSRKYFYIFF